MSLKKPSQSGVMILKNYIVPQSLSKVLLHVVFSTKNREKTIPRHLRSALHAYLAKMCRARGSEAYRVGGTCDHVHIACTLPRTLTMAKLVEEMTTTSSAWMKQQDGVLHRFSWQTGYGVFSLGKSQLPMLLQYVDDQEEHHRTKSFKEELLDFLGKYGVDYDPKYLWD